MRLKKLSDLLARLFAAPPGERSNKDVAAVLPVLMMKTPCLRELDKGTALKSPEHGLCINLGKNLNYP